MQNFVLALTKGCSRNSTAHPTHGQFADIKSSGLKQCLQRVPPWSVGQCCLGLESSTHYLFKLTGDSCILNSGHLALS